MKDQMEAKVLTNSFTYSHSYKLLLGFVVVFAIGCSFYIASVWQFAALLGALSVVAYLAWTMGHVSSVEDTVASTLEFLVEEGFLEQEVIDGEIIVLRIEDLTYLEENDCGCGGLFINRSATKGHRENGKDYEKE
jgi:hypothetical protein